MQRTFEGQSIELRVDRLERRIGELEAKVGMPQRELETEARVVVYVDGGCHGNGTEHARGYGSYKIGAGDVARVEHPTARTNNEAEYMTLGLALAELWANEARGVTVKMDSSLVVNQVNGRWRVKEPRMKPLCESARRYLEAARATLEWVRREEIEAVLGH
jgi:ribonuclease HI